MDDLEGVRGDVTDVVGVDPVVPRRAAEDVDVPELLQFCVSGVGSSYGRELMKR
jgi:hypothetical protein